MPSPDEAYPADLIARVFVEAIPGETPQKVALPAPLDPLSYFGDRRVDPQVFRWPGGWK